MELDYDLRGCLENNPQPTYTAEDIAESRFAGLPDTFLINAHDEPEDVTLSLRRQLIAGKDKTWREKKDDEFDNPPFIERK